MTPVNEARILLVEDDVYAQRVLRKRLESEGYEVAVASDGREGMKAIVTWEPDVVVSDWMMPAVDGLELCQSVKTGLKEAAPYFILLTAKNEVDDRLLGLRTGADDYVVKPCDQGELLTRIRAGIRIVRLTRELTAALAQLHAANDQLAVNHEHLEKLQELLPICASCKRVRGADGSWQDLEQFAKRHFGKPLGPHPCPDCAASRRELVQGA